MITYRCTAGDSNSYYLGPYARWCLTAKTNTTESGFTTINFHYIGTVLQLLMDLFRYFRPMLSLNRTRGKQAESELF